MVEEGEEEEESIREAVADDRWEGEEAAVGAWSALT